MLRPPMLLSPMSVEDPLAVAKPILLLSFLPMLMFEKASTSARAFRMLASAGIIEGTRWSSAAEQGGKFPG